MSGQILSAEIFKMQNISSNNQIEQSLCKLKIFKSKQKKSKNLKIITSEKNF